MVTRDKCAMDVFKAGLLQPDKERRDKVLFNAMVGPFSKLILSPTNEPEFSLEFRIKILRDWLDELNKIFKEGPAKPEKETDQEQLDEQTI